MQNFRLDGVNYVFVALLVCIAVYVYIPSDFISMVINALLGGLLALTVANRKETTVNNPSIDNVEITENDNR